MVNLKYESIFVNFKSWNLNRSVSIFQTVDANPLNGH